MTVKGAIMVPHPPLIIPEVGRGQEKTIQDTVDAFHEAAKIMASWRPDTVVVISPHTVMYADYFHISPGKGAKGDFGRFGASRVKVETRYDTELVEAISRIAREEGIPAGTAGERDSRLDHGTMIPLWFLDHYLSGYMTVRIGLSGLPLSEHIRLGECIRKAAESCGRDIAVIASGDLSHKLKEDGPYGYSEEGPEYDRRIMEVMGSGDFEKLLDFSNDLCEKAAECGHRSFTIMAGVLDGSGVSARKLSYEGPFGVGYGVCVYEAAADGTNGNAAESGDPYVRLARYTVEGYTRTGNKPEMPHDLPPEMYSEKAGVFVSLKKNGELRGCIGTIAPVRKSIAEEIMENAISSCSRDPRFPAVEATELDDISYSVDVLGRPEEISSADELDVRRYGVIVSRGYNRGLLLPDLEGIDTPEEQIAIAKMKAGISPAERNVRLQRFEVVRHS